MSRSLATGLARVLGAALLAASLPCAAAEVTLKVVTVFPRNHTFNIPVFEMLNEVNAKGKGVLQFQYIGGPEAVPVTEQEMPDYYRIVRELTNEQRLPMPRHCTSWEQTSGQRHNVARASRSAM